MRDGRKRFSGLGWSVVLIAGISILCYARQYVRHGLMTSMTYQQSLDDLALALSGEHTGSDALENNEIHHLVEQTNLLLQELPATQRIAWTDIQNALVTTSAVATDSYTSITRQLQDTLEDTNNTLESVRKLVLIEQQYARLEQQDMSTAQRTLVENNSAGLAVLLPLRAQNALVKQALETQAKIQQARAAATTILATSRWLIEHVQQVTISDPALLTCRKDLLDALRKEQKATADIITRLAMSDAMHQTLTYTCLVGWKLCVTDTARTTRNTNMQAVSTGVQVQAEQYVSLRAKREKKALLDAQDLCVRREKRDEQPKDIQNKLQQAMQAAQPMMATGSDERTTSGVRNNDMPFEDRQDDALDRIERRQQQRLQEVTSGSTRSFGDRIQDFFLQFKGKR